MWQVNLHPEAKATILNLETPARAKTLKVLELLGEYGPLLRQPHSKKLVGYSNLFELRTSGSPAVRLLYTSYNQIFHVLHIFLKKTSKTPSREIDLAQSRIGKLTK